MEAREAALSAQLAVPAERARAAHARLAALQREAMQRRAALCAAADEAAKLAEVLPSRLVWGNGHAAGG